MGPTLNIDKRDDNSDIQDDDLDFEDEKEGGMLRWLSMGFVLVALGGFVGLAWYAYQSGMQPVNEEDIPLIATDDLPFKEKPKDPGGLQFEHQDKSVYNQLASGNAGERPMAERLLPLPEQPVERPAAEITAPENFQKEEVNQAPAEAVVAGPAPKVEESQPVAPVQSAEVTPVKPAEEPKPAQPLEKVEAVNVPEKPVAVETMEAKPVATAPKASASAPAATKSGQFMAQLGAFSSEADAEAAWTKVKAAHGSMFPTKTHAIQRADLGNKGVFHRLQMGPFESEDAARKVCAYLQENKQGCFIVSVK